MPWTIELSPAAGEELAQFPRDQQAMISRAIDRMHDDPFAGNVKPLKGQWHGRFRKVVGRYRLIFIPHYPEHHVEISTIRPRTEKTYR